MEYYEDEEEFEEKIYILFTLFKIIIILLFIYLNINIKEPNNKESSNSKIYYDTENKTLDKENENSNVIRNISTHNKPNNTIYNSTDIINIKIDNIKKDVINNSEFDNILSNYDLSLFPKVGYLNMTYTNYYFSHIFNRTKLEYNIGIYDNEKKIHSPSNLTLYYDLKFVCFLFIPKLNVTIYSLANNYEDKYINCIEYFEFGENVSYGIKIFKDKIYNITINFTCENTINYTDSNHINDSMFDPDMTNQQYLKSVEEINKNNSGKLYYLKNEYFRQPNIDLRRNNITSDLNWTFNNFYNDYYCCCVGNECLKKEISQECKYLFYMTIIDKYRYLYPKTEYIFADFIFNYLSSDDAYPIFQEMIKQNYPAHYITQNKNYFRKYCGNDKNCKTIINVDIPKYIRYGDAVEKHLTLILKIKAFITCRSTDFHKVGILFYKVGYITYITVGHGVCFFKDYLFSNQRIYGPDMNDKILIPPSEPLISIALKFGWKLENIIKINLPKWDKYDGYNKEIIENYIHNISNNSILVMFTYRMTRVPWNLNMSEYYFENITKLIFNDRLKKELKENQIILYYSMHRMVNPGYQRKYNEKLRGNKYIRPLPQSSLSECLSKTNLVVTDFSSIMFDLMYRNKPFVIYLPDADDPLIDQLYTLDYINLIRRMNKREFDIANICNNVEETVDKIIFYIKNKFTIDSELKKFFDYIGIKREGSNIQKFIDYLTDL